MIDRRKLEGRVCEVDDRLAPLSDTSVLEAFRLCLNALLPHLETTYSHQLDPWDEVSEPLYHKLVHLVFASKYGIGVPAEEIHKYGFTNDCYRHCFHVECLPKTYPLKVLVGATGEAQLSEEDLQGCILVFEKFVDDEGGDPSFERSGPATMLTRASICIANKDTGYRIRKYAGHHIHVAVDSVDFEWVAETFVAEEHGLFRGIYFEEGGSDST